MQAAIVVTWTHPVPGREQKGLAYAAEVEEYWGQRAREGKCSQPETFFSERGGGLWMVKGERDTLMQIHDSDENRMLIFKGDLLLENFSVDICYAGESAADYLQRYASALSTIS